MLKPYVHALSNTRLKVILYGYPGMGKTTLAATLQSVGKVLFLNVEGGMLSVTASDDILVVDMQGMSANFLQELDTTISVLYNRDEKAYPWLKGIETIVVDSGSELQSAVIEAVVDEAILKNPKRSDTNEVWLEDYGKVTIALSSFFRRLKSLPYNIVITALARETRTKEGNILTEVKPDFTAKLSEKVMGYVDHVWYMYRSEDELEDEETGEKYTILVPSIITQPIGVYKAKTRGHKFAQAIGSRVLDPNLGELHALLQQTQGT